jgi:hypothetical protein
MKNNLVNLVFIYLGEKLPKYFVANVNLTAKNFPYQTYLFVQEGCLVEEDSIDRAKVNVTELRKKNLTELSFLKHDLNFRDGFWLYTFERLLYLKDIHEKIGGDIPILHIEGDLLLLPSFSLEMIQCKSLKWFRHNTTEDVASLVYLPNLEATEWLHERLLDEALLDPFVTDMSALFRIRMKNPDRVETISDMFSSPSEEQVFDGLAFGQWLTGMDPRNTYGFQILHENGDFVSYSNSSLDTLMRKTKVFISEDNFLCLKRDKTNLIVHSLHIHSKDQDLFDRDYVKKLQVYVDKASDKEVYFFSFSRSILFESLKRNYLDKTLTNYLINFAKFLTKGETCKVTRFSKGFMYFLRSTIKWKK